MHSESILHQGKVQRVTSNTVEVEIQTESACAHCTATDQCVSADSKTRKIIINNYQGPALQEGKFVTLTGQKANGLSAVLIAYLVPFLLVIITLFVSNAFIQNEAISGLLALGILIPYYTVIWLLKGRLQKRFTFKIIP